MKLSIACKLTLKQIFLLCSLFPVLQLFAQRKPLQLSNYTKKFESSSLLFIENKGQVVDKLGRRNNDILFTAKSYGAKVYLTSSSIHYQFTRLEYPKGYNLLPNNSIEDQKKKTVLSKQIKSTTKSFSVSLNGANSNPTVIQEGRSFYHENFFLPYCGTGITNVHGYEKITFKNVYPKVDWVVYSKGDYMEYDFLIHPGGDPADIKLKISNVDVVSIPPQGELLMKTGLGEVKEKAPLTYADGTLVASSFKQNSDGTIGFDVQPQLGKELRIDPSIVWSTYYGGPSVESGKSVATDATGNVYLCGSTQSSFNVASGGYQNTYGGDTYDAFLIKFNSAGNRLWATYYGGSGVDNGNSCAVDTLGNVYMTGETGSTSGIAFNAFQNTFGGGSNDAFLVKFDSLGNRLWATYYGGSNYDGGNCVTTAMGNVYLTGSTLSNTAIAAGGFQNSRGGNYDAFLVRFNTNGTRIWGTYYGGSADDFAGACGVDNSKNIYIAGSTSSTFGISSGGSQNNFGGGTNPDAMLIKFDSSGNRIWGTYYGGNGYDFASSCAIDFNDNIFLVGSSFSTNAIASSGFQNTLAGQSDAFCVKFNSTGTRLWGSYCGGTGIDDGYGCTVDNNGNLFLIGTTNSATNISSNGFQNVLGGQLDAMIVKINPSGIRLWGSYLGGNNYENGFVCKYDSVTKSVYLAGQTKSLSGIAVSGFQNTLAGPLFGTYYDDAFLAKLDGSKSLLVLCPNGSVSITSPLSGVSYQWQVSQDGNNWVNLIGPAALSQTLQLNNVPSSNYGYQYRCVINGSIYTDAYQLQFRNQWTGTISSAWENPANWSCGVVPDGNTDIVINNGPVILNSDGICRTLTVRPGVSFTVTSGNTLTITH